MPTRLLRCLTVWFALGLLTSFSLTAQPVTRTSDEKWSDLVRLTRERPDATGGRGGVAAARRAQQEHLRAVADAAAAFVREHPAHAQAAEARRWEAKGRLTAVLLGGDPLPGALQGLAEEVRRDSRLPATARYEVAYLAELANHSADGLRPKDRGAWLAARERSARVLIAEFPGLPGGYGLLLQVAGRTAGAPSAALARELTLSGAPADIRAAAQERLDRHALAGRPLAEVTADALGASKVLESSAGKPLILYTWSSANPGSLALAKDIARLAPAGAMIIAVNLGRDVAAAQAAAGQLPGVQLYEGRGFDSPLVQALRLTSAPLVYLVDRQGVIRSTEAHHDLAAQLAGLEGQR